MWQFKIQSEEYENLIPQKRSQANYTLLSKYNGADLQSHFREVMMTVMEK